MTKIRHETEPLSHQNYWIIELTREGNCCIKKLQWCRSEKWHGHQNEVLKYRKQMEGGVMKGKKRRGRRHMKIFFVPRLLCFFQILLFPDLYWQPCAQLLETQQPTPPQQNNFQPTSHLDTTWQTETLKYCVGDGMGNGRAKKRGCKCKHGNTWFLPQWNFYWEQDVTNKKPHQKTAPEINIALTLIVPSKMCILHC